MRRLVVFVSVLLSALAVMQGDGHAEERFVAVMNGANAGNSSTGTGTAVLILHDDLVTIDYTITVTGLSSAEMGAHIHRPDRSIAFDFGLGSPKTGVWMFPFPTDVTMLRNNQLYVNIHSANYPGGEIRGTLVLTQLEVDEATWGSIKALYR